ncbi:RES family NAD+ phosphorylase [Flavihumibacter petaseus]|uniref:RES domain-containing protein n=1 Tax=Flavihumibacter petaseus NBRC 106054 TaxID=1220578 RepID=A0A0E9MXR1_9BACT|nr:RES family NAD+ phosphorylase [Flavihumibacter petaseus]GAO42298.1 hypothetical protein FPE01S_01_13110 [Flavihumibacter petaseus NBRC 106054]
MEVFRIVKEEYSETLSSSGSANRWNRAGQLVIYTGASRSLSSLELVVHKGAILPTVRYKVLVISIADDDHLVQQIRKDELPYHWRTMAAYSALQKIGSDWYSQQRSLCLKIPSAIVPQEYNYLINTEHPAFIDNVRLVRTENYFWDSRLL